MQITIVLVAAIIPAILVYYAYKGDTNIGSKLLAYIVLGLWEAFALSFLFV